MFFLFLAIIIVIILSLLTELEIEIKIIIKNGINYSFIALRLLRGILHFRFNLSLKKIKESFRFIILRKTDSQLHKDISLEKVFKLLKNNHKQLLNGGNTGKYIFSKLKIKNLSLNLELGTGNAAETAIICGAVVIIFSSIQSYIQNRYLLGQQPLRVFPYFSHKVFNMDLDCIIRLRIGHIIIAGTRIIGKKFKGGEKSGRTSY